MIIELNKDLFAAWTGLTASGYPLADREDGALQRLIAGIRAEGYQEALTGYFAWARTDRYAVNPYWPRGSALSAACFFIEDGRLLTAELAGFLAECAGEPVERELTDWLAVLPDRLREITALPGFDALWQDYRTLVRGRMESYRRVGDGLAAALRVFFGEERREDTPVFAPNLLQSPPMADFIRRRGRLTVIAVDPELFALLHEHLHPILTDYRALIVSRGEAAGWNRLYDAGKLLEMGYLNGDTTAARVHAVEESFVRGVSLYLSQRGGSSAADQAEWSGKNGFRLVPWVYRNACLRQPTFQSLGAFIADTLDGYADRGSGYR